MAETLETYISERPSSKPMIYAYTDTQYPGCLKVGYTAVGVDKRVAQQYPTKRPDGKVPYKIVLRESAMYDDGGSFTDHDVHKILKRKGVKCVGGEWFRCSVNDVKSAIIAVRTRSLNIENRTETFSMRPEQQEAVDKTIHYFQSCEDERKLTIPKFLWNCKMRFGKTFTAYQLAKKMNLKKILILTFKPAVKASWYDDLMSHVDFEGWQFISNYDESGLSSNQLFKRADKNKPIVCFGSFQDFLGTNENGGIKAKNEWVHTTNWDLVIFDEYHFGAWRENAKNLFDEMDDEAELSAPVDSTEEVLDETWLPITTSYYLYLSGTPFRAINSGEFIEDQIYNWTYSDEQKAKEEWVGENNPYLSLPKMIMLTYKMPDSITQIAKQGEYDEFDLNVFFSAAGKDENAQFKYKDYVQKWLDLIRGSYMETSVDELKLGAQKPPMPFSDTRLLNVLQHTFWYLPNVASCYAMQNLLNERQNIFYHDYTINVCAGTQAGTGAAALEPVQRSMANPLESKTITLSCGKLTTGVTIKPWTGVFMLRNLKSPESYFQTAFRVQSPWTIKDDSGKTEIIKKECFVFDFALNRALKQISDYSCKLNYEENNPEKKVGEFIHFLPVLAYDGSAMQAVDAASILDMAMAGTSATLLAKRWESALLVNVDNETLLRLLNNKEAMEALMRIEGFRSLNSDIETIINKSENIKKAKKDEKAKTPKEKKQISEEEKEMKSKRKQIQEKLMKFATRIPVFMYLSEYREMSLKDVITQLEPALFRRVTGLSVKDFELLVSLNVFNESLMNDAVYKFKRYEDSSLEYTGVDMHKDEERVGLYSTSITKEEYLAMAGEAEQTMAAPAIERYVAPATPKSVSAKPIGKSTSSKPAETKTIISTRTVMPASKSDSSISKSMFLAGSSFTQPKPKKPKIEVDFSKIKVGVKVKHKAFGEGNITSIKGNTIKVMFTSGTEKQFLMEMSFTNGFLTLV